MPRIIMSLDFRLGDTEDKVRLKNQRVADDQTRRDPLAAVCPLPWHVGVNLCRGPSQFLCPPQLVQDGSPDLKMAIDFQLRFEFVKGQVVLISGQLVKFDELGLQPQRGA